MTVTAPDIRFETATQPDAACRSCDGTGWADPWEVTGGAPALTWCDRCLGAGLDDCPSCDGYGAVAAPVACPTCESAPLAA
jgi:DnaJ-class molecular chaperone